MAVREQYSTWVEVSLGAIEDNVRYFVEHSKAQVMAIVKANAYGHGATQAAQAALRGGARWCGVARVEEALELRHGGLECPLLILGLTPPGRIAEMVAARVSMAVWQREQVDEMARAASQLGVAARLHLKVDTGMSRLGATVEQATALAKYIRETPDLCLEGLFSHYARADEQDPGPTDEQAQLFRRVLKELDHRGLKPPLVHMANSAATLKRPEDHFDLVRVGIAMYGMHPSRECALPAEIRPALAWKTQLSQVRILPRGRGVSYGHIYITRARERMGTLPVGYADGFRRGEGNQALVSGRRVPVVGRVCMDQCVVRLDAAPEAGAGDEVVLIGVQDGERISAEEVAERWDTINYEVTCGISARVPRLYL